MWRDLARVFLETLARFALLQAEANERGLTDADVYHLRVGACHTTIWVGPHSSFMWAANVAADDAACRSLGAVVACIVQVVTSDTGVVPPLDCGLPIASD